MSSLPGEVGLNLSRRPSQRQRHQEERRRHPALHPAVLQDGEETVEEARSPRGGSGGEERREGGEGVARGGQRDGGFGERKG